MGVLSTVLPALLALYLLNRDRDWSPVAPRVGELLGLNRQRWRFDLVSGLALTLAIGVPGLGLYLAARELGFNAIEISDGTIEMDARTRAEAIGKAVKAGFRVLSEVGKKDPADAQPMAALAEVVNADLDGGASMVIMEAREAGKGVAGACRSDHVAAVGGELERDRTADAAARARHERALPGQLGRHHGRTITILTLRCHA